MWSDPLSVDTETALIACGLLAPPLAVTATADSVSSMTGLYAPGDPAVRDLLATRCIVGANFAYDAGVYMAHDPDLIEILFDAYDADRVRDVQHDQRLLDIAEGCLDGYWTNPIKGRPVYVKYTYSLDALYQRYGYPPLDKDTWRLRYGELIGVPLEQWPEGALEYPAQDAIATLQVHLDQTACLEPNGRRSPYAGQPDVFVRESCAQARAALALHLMSCWGMYTDPVHVDRVIAFVEAAAARARTVCDAGGILTPTGNRRMALIRDRVLTAYADRPILITEAGNKAIGADPKKTIRLPLADIRSRNLEKYVSTDGDVLTGSGDAVLEAVQMYGSASTRLKKATTLRRGAYGGGTPLQTRFDVLKETGRTSSKAPGGTMIGDNFQNFARASAYPRKDADGWGLYATPTSRFRLAGPYPTRAEAARVADSIDIRGAFVADPGMVLCSVDYPSAELNMWAQHCVRHLGYSRMAETLNAGRDPHLLLACERLLKSGAIDYDTADARLAAKDTEVSDARQFAKVPNYGLLGLLGPETFIEYAAGQGYVLSLEYAQYVHKAHHETWDEFPAFMRWVKERDTGAGVTIQLDVSGRIRGGATVPAGCNYTFQGPAADMAKLAGARLWRECLTGRTWDTRKESPLYGSKPLLFLHDEYLMMHPIDVQHDAGKRFEQIMYDSSTPYLPDVPFKRDRVEAALMHRWHKSAKAVYDSNGHLVEWKPEYK